MTKRSAKRVCKLAEVISGNISTW